MIILEPFFFQMAITLGHRWTMRSNLHKSNGLDAFFKSTPQQFFWKCDLDLPKKNSVIDQTSIETKNYKILNF
jgi:hypothetical protein